MHAFSVFPLYSMRIFKYLCGLCLLASSCVTPYDASVHNHVPRLVIDGLISTLPDRSYVRVSYSGAYSNDRDGFLTSVADAQVRVKDQTGQTFVFERTSYGTYESARPMKGVVGNTYQVFITLADGNEYQSDPELLKPVPPIDSLYWEYTPATQQIEVYLDITDSPTPGNGYFWKATHYEEISICNGGEDGITACQFCCTRCWEVVQCRQCIHIAGDQFVNGNKIRRQRLATVPFDSKSPYFLLIEQRSLTAAGYRFWNAVRAQTTASGGPFDAAPAPVTGNLRNVTNPDEPVLGFFGASEEEIRPYWLMRQNINGTPSLPNALNCPPASPPPPCYPCEESVVRTARKPLGWDR